MSTRPLGSSSIGRNSRATLGVTEQEHALPRRKHIEIAIAAYNRTRPDAPLRRSAARLLTVMFSAGDECRQTWEALTAEGFSREDLKATLRQLVEAGFLSRGPTKGHTPVTYHLHLPPQQPAGFA
jgi:hypothetical protein